MMHQFVIFSGLVLSASCMVLHQAPIPVTLGVQYHDTPNYNFAYEVNDAHTGDIKSQHESRRGDTVLGQYSLLQPDGVRRTVDYRADEHAGFRATVNNEGRQNQNEVNDARQAQPNPAYWATTQSPTPAPAVAISRSSIVQTFSSPVHIPQYNQHQSPVLTPQQYNNLQSPVLTVASQQYNNLQSPVFTPAPQQYNSHQSPVHAPVQQYNNQQYGNSNPWQ